MYLYRESAARALECRGELFLCRVDESVRREQTRQYAAFFPDARSKERRSAPANSWALAKRRKKNTQRDKKRRALVVWCGTSRVCQTLWLNLKAKHHRRQTLTPDRIDTDKRSLNCYYARTHHSLCCFFFCDAVLP